jgi:hypothetical protein
MFNIAMHTFLLMRFSRRNGQDFQEDTHEIIKATI